jgi:hypothetical protein
VIVGWLRAAPWRLVLLLVAVLLRGLVLRRQPLPPRRRLGRTMTGTLWRAEAGLEGEQLGVPGKDLEGSQGISYGQASLRSMQHGG